MKKTISLTCLAVLFPLTCHLHAASITLVNGDFESTTTTGANQSIDGWIESGGNGNTGDPNYTDDTITGIPTIAGFLKANDGNWIGQVISGLNPTSFGEYTLTLDYGMRTAATTAQTDYGTNVDFRVSLWDSTAGTELAGQTISIVNPGVQTANVVQNTTVTLTYDNSAQNASNELQLRITHLNPIDTVLDSPNGGRGWRATAFVDNLQLNSVPEPSAFLLSALGALGLLKRRR